MGLSGYDCRVSFRDLVLDDTTTLCGLPAMHPRHTRLTLSAGSADLPRFLEGVASPWARGEDSAGCGEKRTNVGDAGVVRGGVRVPGLSPSSCLGGPGGMEGGGRFSSLLSHESGCDHPMLETDSHPCSSAATYRDEISERLY